MTWSPLALMSSFIAFDASARPIVPTIVAFFARAMKMLPSGAIDRAAGLRQDDRCVSVWKNDMPIARAASACPAGTVLMPERIASQTNAAV